MQKLQIDKTKLANSTVNSKKNITYYLTNSVCHSILFMTGRMWIR